MIPYDDIVARAERWWPEVLKAELTGEAFFPKVIQKKRFPKGTSTAEQFAVLEQVRNNSKAIVSPTETEQVLGYGYTYHLAETGLSAKNRIAKQLTFDRLEDYLAFTKKQELFTTFKSRVEKVRSAFPELEDWLVKNAIKLVEFEELWDRIDSVLNFFQTNPRPNLYLRELQLPVDTKFIERNVKLLDELLELVLPDDAIDSNETVFEKKYGLQWVEPLIRISFLDADLLHASGEKDSDFGLPVRTLANRDWPVNKVLVIENLTTLLSLRDKGVPNVLGLHGHGYRVANFIDLKWLHQCQLYYWGDIDVQGFEILSLFRQRFPHAKSILMDPPTIDQTHPNSKGTGKPSRWRKPPQGLTDAEFAGYQWAKDGWNQIEQEHLPMDYVLEVIQRVVI